MVRVRGELPVERLNSYCSWEAESRGEAVVITVPPINLLLFDISWDVR